MELKDVNCKQRKNYTWIILGREASWTGRKSTTLSHCISYLSGIDRIEYDVTVQISAKQDGVCERVCVCVHACAIEIKQGTLRAA